jgi:uncharacterized membrane protein
MNKKMKMFLSFSMLLNVLLIGVLVGGASKPHFDQSKKPQTMEKRLTEIINVLPPEKATLFKLRVRELRSIKKTDKEQMKLARKNILQIFGQDPFDKVAYRKAIQALNQLHQNQMDKRVDLMTDVAEYLSPKERKQLSKLIMGPRTRK